MKNRIYNSIKNHQITIARGQQSIINWLRGGTNKNDENDNESNDNDENDNKGNDNDNDKDEDNELNPSIHACETNNITYYN